MYFGHDHDTILFYAMDENATIHPDRSDFPSSESTIKRWGKYADENGFVSNKHFAGSNSTIINTDDETKGFSIYNGIPRDWWEISSNVSKGNTNEVIAGKYATQKPEALLERIIKASSNEGMIVADFFGGSGVTAAVASRLNRNFIHVDVGINSIQTARDRLVNLDSSFDILEINDGVSLFRNPVQTMEKLRKSIVGLKNEDGLDKFWEGAISDPKYGMVPVYLPNLMDSTSRILDTVLMRRIIREALPDFETPPKKVIVYYVDITGLDEIRNYISKVDDLATEIELRDLKVLLDDFVVEDEAEFEFIEDRSNVQGHAIRIDRFYSDAVDRRIQQFNLKSKQNAEGDGKSNKKAKTKFTPITLSENGLELIEYISLDYDNHEPDAPWHSDYELKIGIDSKVSVNGKKTDKYWDGKVPCDRRPARMKIRNICGDETIFTLG